MVVAIGQGEPTGSMTVVDVGGVWTHNVLFEGHDEASEATDVAPRWIAGVSSSGPQTSLHLIRAGHSLQGLQQEKCTVLTPSCYMQTRKQTQL